MNSPKSVKELTSILGLEPHPEGGFFKETYRSEGTIPAEVLGSEFKESRNYATGIYFLLTSNNFSAFHRIKQDEMWHFYEGAPLTIHMIDSNGNYSSKTLGLELTKGQVPQYTVAAGVWFASEVVRPDTYSLVGCTVFPGFDFADFELAEREELVNLYPDHTALISRLSRL